MMSKTKYRLLLLVLIIFQVAFASTTGKITGKVVDKETGEPLLGVNVILEGGGGYGAATNADGFYVILNVPPGVYKLKTAMIGYTIVTELGIEVYIDQTTTVDFELGRSVIQGEEVVVTTKRNIVHKDVSTSVLSVDAEEIETSIHTSVENIIGEQAGIEGLRVRGGEVDETAFMIDGVTSRNPRNNEPIAGVALSGIQSINVKRGGFEAEYGQVRGGIVNVITREGSINKYTGTVTIDYNPPEPDYWDSSPFSYDSYFNRPYFDDEVAWTGTAANWPEYLINQYPQFEGWDKVSENSLKDDDPNNDVTPLGAQLLEGWRRRKEPVTNIPDATVDAGFGGPVPMISEQLGNLRFFATYKRDRRALLVPLSTDDYTENNFRIKLTSNISDNMKLDVSLMSGNNYYNAQNWSYQYYIDSETEVAGEVDERALFGTGYYSISDQKYDLFSATLNHTLSNKSFYKVSLSRVHTRYRTHPPAMRDTSRVYDIVPEFQAVDEAPFNWWPELTPYSNEPYTFNYGGHVTRQRDTSDVYTYGLKADYTSQINNTNQIKTGIDIQLSRSDLSYGEIQMSTKSQYVSYTERKDRPIQAAWYIQDKLETKGFVLNVGLRADLYTPNTEWWNPTDPFDDFYSAKYNDAGADTLYEKSKAKLNLTWSPRFGISHPITETSKLFFNYGHFNQLPAYEDIFRLVRADSRVLTQIGSTDLIPAKTVAYELGLDKSIADQYLLRISAYYRDITDQNTTTRYIGISGVDYQLATNNSFEDIRGLEISLSKDRGKWFTMLANYTYQANSDGEYGRGEIYEDPSRQQDYDKDTQERYQNRPIPQPYARVNMSLHTPNTFGPKILGTYLLGGWELTSYYDWKAVGHTTRNPNNVSGIVNNVETPEFVNLDLKLSKRFEFKNVNIYIFSNVFNAFNIRRLAMHFGDPAGLYGDGDAYWSSLHLPESEAYDNIPGNDKYGDFREPGVEYQPMRRISSIDDNSDPGLDNIIYYEIEETCYKEYVDGAWVPVDGMVLWEKVDNEWINIPYVELDELSEYDENGNIIHEYKWTMENGSRIDKILDDKAYIDMPNESCFNFLNPRNITFGIKISFNL